MNKTLWQYYVDKASEITDNALTHIKNLNDWEIEKKQRKKEFFISMGLNVSVENLSPVIKILGEFKGKGFTAKKIAYQILPDCWSSGHFYIPNPLPEKKLPAVLYVCGHAGIGTHWYQKHPVMWAKRGYACFIFETIKQSENTGWHHGLFSGKRLDWISLGYTAAGGELLNSICALIVLCQMPEVDVDRIGATGISGGGAHSHFLAIADERIKAVATSAGISTLKSAIGNRTMFQHCDCMFANGVFQRDSCDFSALIAPRAVLYCFASQDNLFSVEEYRTLYEKVKKIYQIYGCPERCELFEYPGPHAYSNESIKKINQWFDRFVAEEKHPDIGLSDDVIPEHTMSVFNGKSPQPNRLDLLPEFLTVQRTRHLPENKNDWEIIRKEAVQQLKNNVFHWLKRCDEKMEIKNIGNWDTSEKFFSRFTGETAGMETYIEAYFSKKPAETTILALGDYRHDTITLMKKIGEPTQNCNLILIESRGCGRNAADITQGNYCLLRAGALVGITPVMMWINDLKYIVEFFRNLSECANTKFFLYGIGEAAGACLYYSIFDEKISATVVDDVVDTHKEGCYIPGILKEIDITDASGLLAPRVFGVVTSGVTRWVSMMHWGVRVYERLGIRDKYIMKDSVFSAITEALTKI